MEIWLRGVSLDSCTQRLCSTAFVSQLIEGFTSKQVHIRRASVQRENFLACLQDTLILLAPQTTLSQGHAQGNILRVLFSHSLQIGNSYKVVLHSKVSHTN